MKLPFRYERVRVRTGELRERLGWITFFTGERDGGHMSTGVGPARHVRNGIRYAAVGVVLLAAWNFLAPHAGAPSWAPYLDVLPVIAGRTETSGLVNATHVGVLAVAAVVVMRV
ncbi:hypothetical protein [Halorubrum halodurans]|nr:hypothetical protein [Halorubrum halodurans]